MADAGLDVRDADIVIGTSAGARAGTQLMSGLALHELFARQIASPRGPALPKSDRLRWREGPELAVSCSAQLEHLHAQIVELRPQRFGQQVFAVARHAVRQSLECVRLVGCERTVVRCPAEDDAA